MTNSRAKGKRGELDAAKEWAAVMGGSCRRGQQFSGGNDSPDLVHDYPGIHLEVKRAERGNPFSWLRQAIADCQGRCPAVLHRRSNEPWILIVRLSDVPRFLLEASAGPQAEAVGRGALPRDDTREGVPPPAGTDGGVLRVLPHGQRHGAGRHRPAKQPGTRATD